MATSPLVWLATSFSTVGEAKAAAIAIVNAGFEQPDTTNLPPVPGTGEVFTFADAPGWSLLDPADLIPDEAGDRNLGTGYPGVWSPSAVFYPDGIPEGRNIGTLFLPQAPGSGEVALTQTLSSVLEVDTTYALSVDVGNPADPGIDLFTGFPGYRIELLAGGTVLAADDNGLAIAEGTFETASVSYTAKAGDPNLSEPLEIRLFGTLSDGGNEVNFDRVVLEADPVPEPTSAIGVLVALAAGGVTKLRGLRDRAGDTNA